MPQPEIETGRANGDLCANVSSTAASILSSTGPNAAMTSVVTGQRVHASKADEVNAFAQVRAVGSAPPDPVDMEKRHPLPLVARVPVLADDVPAMHTVRCGMVFHRRQYLSRRRSSTGAALST